jgi:hypothetical protein
LSRSLIFDIYSSYMSYTPRWLLASFLGLTVVLSSSSALAADLRAAIAAQNSVTPGLMKKPGILGTAVTVNEGGQPTVVIYVDQDSKRAAALVAALNRPVAGIPVQIELTDQFRALVKPSAGRPGGHTTAQSVPIKMGTTGGWRYDLANGYCCGGTLGALVQVNGVQYILSNYHVFEADTSTTGSSVVAESGQPVIHPGLIDVSCNQNNALNVGTLQVVQSLPSKNVDVGLALAGSAVDSSGAILEIGTISSQTEAAWVGQPVKKSGRTTGLSRSSVAALNATISVTYDNECAGAPTFTKTFTGQIVINNRGSKFLAGGDSGSLMVEDVTTNPRAVGLLYAGSSSSAIANPIGEVLAFVGEAIGGIGAPAATMVGQ